MADQSVALDDSDFEKIAEISEGYSGADMASLCKEAAYGPIRDIGHDIQNIEADKVIKIEALIMFYSFNPLSYHECN